MWSHGDNQVVPTICDEVVIPYTSANNGKDSNFDDGQKLDDEDTCAESTDESVDMHVQLSIEFLKHLSNGKENNYIFKLLFECLGDKLQEEEIQSWVYKALGMRKKRFIDRLNRWMGGSGKGK